MKEVLMQSSLLYAHSENSFDNTKILVVVIQVLSIVGLFLFTLDNFIMGEHKSITLTAWLSLGVAVLMIFGIFISRIREVIYQASDSEDDTFEKSLHVVFLGFNIFGKYIAYALMSLAGVDEMGTQSAVYNFIDLITVMIALSLHGRYARSTMEATRVSNYIPFQMNG
jgi:hypothetical protein